MPNERELGRLTQEQLIARNQFRELPMCQSHIPSLVPYFEQLEVFDYFQRRSEGRLQVFRTGSVRGIDKV